MSESTGQRILLVDIGNTSITMGIGQGARVAESARVPSERRRADVLAPVLREAAAGRAIDGAVVCSVVPRWTDVCRGTIERTFGIDPLIVTHRIQLGVSIAYPRPRTIGADRLANASGAHARYGCPVIVADFGTALTFDIVSDAAAYVGGVIAPGLPLMTDYLADQTALLPRIGLRGGHGAVGKSTAGAMRIGAKIGYRGMVKEIVEHIRQAPGMRGARLCATGGYARWVLSGLDLDVRIDPTLTLYGLQVIYQLNS